MNFFNPSVNELRKSIHDIDDSYNNDWDILAELIQNAVDATKDLLREAIINLEVNCNDLSISITDNGIGIPKENLPDLLKPFSSGKEQDESAIGEKGVGLTFTIFQCDDFYINSGTSTGSAIGIIKDAKTWKYLSDETQLNLDYTAYDIGFQGTKVKLNKLGDLPMFTWSIDQLLFILKTKTAFGYTLKIFGDHRELDINFVFIDSNGNTVEQKIDFKYLTLADCIDKRSIISIREFEDYASTPTLNDRQKRQKLQDKIITDQGSFTYDNRDIKYFSIFVPKRSVWDDFSIKNKLTTLEKLEDSEWIETFGYTTFKNGITLSVKGMPTGIYINNPDSGYAGYWSNLFILFEDPKLKFDIGRKSIHGQTAQKYKKYAKEIFNKYVRLAKFISGSIPTGESEWNRDEIFAEIADLIDIGIPDIFLQKTPKDQEASVAALFYECLGKEKIRNITPLISGYRDRYDLFALWGNRKIVLEFKAHLRSIIRDFNDVQKFFDEVDCVVCWNVDEEDEQAFKDQGVFLTEITTSILSSPREEFPNATHKLDLANVNPVYVIDLKKIITK